MKSPDHSKKSRRWPAALGIYLVLAGLAALFALFTQNFLTVGNLTNVVRQASINLVLATGMTFVILTRGIDLAVGSVLGLGAVVAVQLSLQADWAAAAIPLTLLLGAGLGAGTGAAVGYFNLPPFIVTLGTYTALRGAAYLLAGGTTVINNDLPFAWIGNASLGPVPWLVVIAAGVVLASWALLRHSVLGLRIYAVGGNPEAARLTGINVPGVLTIVYLISGLFAALAGIMSASRLYSANGQLGTGYELDAIAAVILGGASFSGGIGTIAGTVCGALIIAVLTNGLTLLGLSYFWQLVAKGLVIVFAVAIDRVRAARAA